MKYSFSLFLWIANLLQAQAQSFEKEVNIPTVDGIISGTLQADSTRSKTPLVIIIPGSGATDRNGNQMPMVSTNAYKQLSDSLAFSGFSIFRFDKRGVGKSKNLIKSESSLTIDTYVKDVIAIIEFFEVGNRFAGTFLLGHSEGSLVAILAIQRKVNVKGLISIAGASQPGDQILKAQLNGKIHVNPLLNSLYRKSVQPYLISWIRYNPKHELEKVKQPCLIIHGTSDIQLPVSNAHELYSARPKSNLLIIDRMNHVLKDSGEEMSENLNTYSRPELPIKGALISGIREFIIKN